MSYAKPLVTIELEEYNQMLSDKDQLKIDQDNSDISLYKMALYHALMSNIESARFERACDLYGIAVFIRQNSENSISEPWRGVCVIKKQK